MKKLFAMLVAVCLIAALLPTTVFAAAGPARFVFCNGERVADLEVIINQGDAPVYLKVNKNTGGKATANGASESDYNIKVTYEAGKNPTVYLKGAEFETYGDASNDPAIRIGSEKVEDGYNDVSVDIIVQRNSTFIHTKTYGAPHIKSYITGTLTLTREKGTLAMYQKIAPNGMSAMIEAVGDVVMKDANIVVQHSISGHDRTNTIYTTNGNIIIDGGRLTVTTNSDASVADADKPTHKRVLCTAAEEKNIIIQNGAKVDITIRNAVKAFGTKGDVVIKDSTVSVKVTTEKGTIFSDYEPVIEGYAQGYTALGDDAEYDANNFDLYKTFSIEPKITETEPPATEATKPSTEATKPSTEATKPSTEATNPSTEATKPSTEATAPGDKDSQSKPINTNAVILIVALIVIVVSGVAAAVIILKKKAEDAEEKEESEGTTEE